MFGDDIRFERALKELDPADLETFSARFGDWDPGRQKQLLALLVEQTPTTGAYAARSGCEASAALGGRLGIDTTAIGALGDVYERWDGLGIPDGRAGDQLDPVARIVHVAEQAVLGHFLGGEAAARQAVARRAGGQLDPELCAEFSRHGDEVLGALAGPDMLAAVIAVEPPPAAIVDTLEFDRMRLALAIFTDLKGLHLIGHSPHVVLSRLNGLARRRETFSFETALAGRSFVPRLRDPRHPSIATAAKLASLSGGPLLVDTGDQHVDGMLAGYVRVAAGVVNPVAP